MTDHAAGLMRAFVAPDRQDRYLSLLRSARGRSKLRDRLAHFRDLDPRYATRVAGAHGADAICSLLVARGAPSTCYVLSEDSAVDDREMPLDAALLHVVGRGMGTFLSCIAARLAYFEGEEAGERYILECNPRVT